MNFRGCGCVEEIGLASRGLGATSPRPFFLCGGMMQKPWENRGKNHGLTDHQRFWEKVDTSGGCWLWLGAKGQGYGLFWMNGGFVRANRAVWFLTYREEPGDLCVLHRCDNPPCVRPSHLFLGTRFDNTQDMLEKGRGDHMSSERNPMAKLNYHDARLIREIHATKAVQQREIAKCFRVSEATISAVVNDERWVSS